MSKESPSVFVRNVRTPLDNLKWEFCSKQTGLPANAIEAGADHESKLYVARTTYSNHLIPGYFRKEDGHCYVALNGQEGRLNSCQVLVGDPAALHWKVFTNGFIATRAIEGGETMDGEKLYIGRVHVNGVTVVAPGCIKQSDECCHITYEDKASKTNKKCFKNYEVLHV